MIDCLFIGSFLSDRKGSLSVSEFVAEKLKQEGVSVKLASYHKNKLLRLADIVFTILFSRVKIIHIEVYSGPAFRIAEIAAYCAGLKKTPVILTLHGGKLPEFSETNTQRINALFLKAKHIATPSLFLKDFFTKQQGIHIGYLPNSLDLERFPYKRDSYKPFSLLWVRAFGEIYHPEVAVQTLSEIRKKFPLATLTMVGPDLGLLDKTKKLIEELGLTDFVTLKGPVANTELHAFYQTHQVYLNTPAYESFGVAVIEAACCGIPVVSSAVGEIPYLWQHERTMLLVNTPDANSFAKEVEKLFRNEAFALNISTAAKEKAETFNWTNTAPLWANLLNN